MFSIFNKILGDPNQKIVKKLQPIIDKINSLEPEFEKMTDSQIKEKTFSFKERLKKGETLDDILPEAFANVREAAKRTIKQRHFDVQLIGGIILHEGKIAEMKTGEGKTLVATLPLYLNALEGKGAHLVTVNDYLARRDINWMGPIYHKLGLVGACINHEKSYVFSPKVASDNNEATIEYENLREVSRREAYAADITYGTNNEFGFDYLRDNMVWKLDQMVQRDLNYAIVDEVDSILIDEARTPLIISSPDEESAKLYQVFASLVPRLKENTDYNIDRKMRAVTLTEEGIEKMEGWLGIGNIYEEGKVNYVHHLEQALKAEVLFKKDKDYVVKDGEVIIVDDFTGRLMQGRRYSEGLHQAIEAKERVAVQRESKTMATITFQNYFRLYKKLAGMTGTAATSAEEFYKVYKLEVVVVPTNKKMIRIDSQDQVFKTQHGKYQAVVREVKERHKTGQPVLVGTIAVEKSELLNEIFSREGIPCEVLNAKNHEREAQIITRAGERSAVTIATNMAGRGTDIKLGEGVRELGGLHIIGTERHEARRIDNQLRGRAGRQGDPGSTQFFVSMEDELMRVFGADRMKGLMDKLGLPEDQPIENPLISKSIESAQSKIEGYNFDIRKYVLDYDDVMNKHREVIYKKRREILELAEKNPAELKEKVLDMVADEIEKIVAAHMGEEKGSWDTKEILESVKTIFPIPDESIAKFNEIAKNAENKEIEDAKNSVIDYLIELAEQAYGKKEKEMTPEVLRQVEKMVCLQNIDMRWLEHLETMEYMREGIGLRGYGQRDPLIEYKREGYDVFQSLLSSIHAGIVDMFFKVNVAHVAPEPVPKNIILSGADENVTDSVSGKASSPKQVSVQNSASKTPEAGRNDPCPCGAKKADGRPVKYKHCHGKNA